MSILAVKDGNGLWVDLPVPSMDGYECIPNEISKAGRNARGNLYKTRINVKRSIVVSWSALSHKDYVNLITLTSPDFFYVRYWDMQEQTHKEGKFYRGNDLSIMGGPPARPTEGGGYAFSYYVVKMSMEEY